MKSINHTTIIQWYIYNDPEEMYIFKHIFLITYTIKESIQHPQHEGIDIYQERNVTNSVTHYTGPHDIFFTNVEKKQDPNKCLGVYFPITRYLVYIFS